MQVNTVCIIDDDPIFVYGTKVLLNYNRSFGDNIIVFENGKEALSNLSSLLKSNEKFPEVIFLDLNMPLMDGWEFLDEFSKLSLGKKTKVFIVSSSINPKDIQESKKYDLVANFISKPLTDERLKEVLTEFSSKSNSNKL
ncbi:response regulator [Sediminicola sp. 1XM1-17]|uniref:response regulator n=1 Tax=Sediminicola sp. 1XM1-17 TaxID=3127702 RepID=UPI0030778B0A